MSKNDQLVDIGGGTAHISLKIHSDLKMTNPVVCVDPCQEMLDVAQRNGAIAVQAKEFFASRPEYPLKVVLMNGCVRYFTDVDLVFTKLAEYMPDDGVCFVTWNAANINVPLFKAAADTHASCTEELDLLQDVIESKGFKCRMVAGTEPGEMDKRVWYDAIRNRFISCALLDFTDEELEQGIQELEKTFKSQDVLKYDMNFKGFIITKM